MARRMSANGAGSTANIQLWRQAMKERLTGISDMDVSGMNMTEEKTEKYERQGLESYYMMIR